MVSGALIATAALWGASPPEVTLRTEGRWILSHEGREVGPALWRRGLQTSGLTSRNGFLISVGDQRSNFPGHLFVLHLPRSLERRALRLAQAPVPIVPEKRLQDTIKRRYPMKDNPDFEGIAADPLHPDLYYAVIEMDGPYLVALTWHPGSPKATLRRIVSLEVPGVEPWRFDTNYRFEGIAVLGPTPDLVIAYERASDVLPRLLLAAWPPGSESDKITAEVLPVPFDSVPPREGKGLLNANGLAAVYGKPSAGGKFPPVRFLLVLARDQERILVVDPRSWAILKIVSLDLRGPESARMKWVSPEGIAVDPQGGRVFMISDPDSIRGNFKRLKDREPTGRYAQLVPLLFSVKLKEVLPSGGRSACTQGGK